MHKWQAIHSPDTSEPGFGNRLAVWTSTHQQASQVIELAPSHEYDDHLRLIDDKDALGKSITHEYDDDNNVIRSVDRGGHSTVYTYTGRGNMLTRQVALSGTVTLHYDAQDNVTYKRDEAGPETNHEYGPHGDLTHNDETLLSI